MGRRREIRMRKKFFIAVLVVAVAGGSVFYACKKENELLTNESKAKVTKSGALENPFKLSGIVHNAALEAVLENEAFPNMSGEEMWGVMKPIFEAYFGADYVHAPYNKVNETYLNAKELLEAQNVRSLIVQLGDKGALNKNFTSDAITRNNYAILYNYWELLDEGHISFDAQLELTFAIEQEIIANYYSLLNGKIMQIAENDALYMEYKWVLGVVSIGNYSGLCWATVDPYIIWEGKMREALMYENFKRQERAAKDFAVACMDRASQMMSGDDYNPNQNAAVSALGSAR